MLITLITILQLMIANNYGINVQGFTWASNELSCKTAINTLGNLECIYICNQYREWLDDDDILELSPECNGNLK